MNQVWTLTRLIERLTWEHAAKRCKTTLCPNGIQTIYYSTSERVTRIHQYMNNGDLIVTTNPNTRHQTRITYNNHHMPRNMGRLLTVIQ